MFSHRAQLPQVTYLSDSLATNCSRPHRSWKRSPRTQASPHPSAWSLLERSWRVESPAARANIVCSSQEVIQGGLIRGAPSDLQGAFVKSEARQRAHTRAAVLGREGALQIAYGRENASHVV
jgi:hypothetical protein